MTKAGSDEAAVAGEVPQVSRRERKKAQVRQQLYETAMELFHSQGFTETTIEQITDRVDVAPATFFNYFPNKLGVLADYHREGTEELLAFASAIESGSARDRFGQLSDWQQRRAQSEGQIFRVLIQEFLTRPSALVGSMDAALAVMQLLHGWVEDGKKNGEVRPDVDSKLAVITILNISNSTILEWAASPEKVACLPNLREKIGLLFDGLTQGR